MGAWAYCTNEDCQRGFDRPSFAEIIARKRECPACGQINHVGDDLGTALDEKFEEIVTAGSQLVAAGTIVPPQSPAPFVPGEATAVQNLASNIAALRATFGTNTGRFSATSANVSAKPQSAAAGQEANAAPQPLVCTLRIAPHGVIAEIKDLALLPAGVYNVVLISQES